MCMSTLVSPLACLLLSQAAVKSCESSDEGQADTGLYSDCHTRVVWMRVKLSSFACCIFLFGVTM